MKLQNTKQIMTNAHILTRRVKPYFKKATYSQVLSVSLKNTWRRYRLDKIIDFTDAEALEDARLEIVAGYSKTDNIEFDGGTYYYGIPAWKFKEFYGDLRAGFYNAGYFFMKGVKAVEETDKAVKFEAVADFDKVKEYKEKFDNDFFEFMNTEFIVDGFDTFYDWNEAESFDEVIEGLSEVKSIWVPKSVIKTEERPVVPDYARELIA